MTTISNLANRDLDPTTDDEVRSFCKESHFLTLKRTFADRLFSKLHCHELLKSFLSVQDLSQSMAGKFPQCIYVLPTLCFTFLCFVFFKDHIVKSAAGHFALKRLINQDKERIQSASDTGKPRKLCRLQHLHGHQDRLYKLS